MALLCIYENEVLEILSEIKSPGQINYNFVFKITDHDNADYTLMNIITQIIFFNYLGMYYELST